MSDKILIRFRLTPATGGDAVLVPTGGIDIVRAERAYGAPIMGRAQEGYFEPIMMLAFVGAQRQQLVDKTTTFDEFMEAFDVELLDESDEVDGPKATDG